MKCQTPSGNHTQGKKKLLNELSLKSSMEVLEEAEKLMLDWCGLQTTLITQDTGLSLLERTLMTSAIGLIERRVCTHFLELRSLIAPLRLPSQVELQSRQDI